MAIRRSHRDWQSDDTFGPCHDFFIEPNLSARTVYNQVGDGEAEPSSTFRYRRTSATRPGMRSFAQLRFARGCEVGLSRRGGEVEVGAGAGEGGDREAAGDADQGAGILLASGGLRD